MSVKVMSMVWEYSQAKGGDLIILLAIADHADDDGKAFPGEERLAKKGRMTDRNVRHCLKGLQVMDELSVITGRGRGHPNHYQINISLLLSRGKDGNLFQENNTGKVFQEKISRKNPTRTNRKAEKSDTKSGSPFPTNHHITTSPKDEPPEKEIPLENANAFSSPTPHGDGALPEPPDAKKGRRPGKHKHQPTYDPDGYQAFIAAFPRHTALAEAVKAWDWLKPDKALQATILDDIQKRKAEDRKWAEGFITHPSTYLRGERWRDDIIPVNCQRPPPSARPYKVGDIGPDGLRIGVT